MRQRPNYGQKKNVGAKRLDPVLHEGSKSKAAQGTMNKNSELAPLATTSH